MAAGNSVPNTQIWTRLLKDPVFWVVIALVTVVGFTLDRLASSEIPRPLLLLGCLVLTACVNFFLHLPKRPRWPRLISLGLSIVVLGWCLASAISRPGYSRFEVEVSSTFSPWYIAIVDDWVDSTKSSVVGWNPVELSDLSPGEEDSATQTKVVAASRSHGAFPQLQGKPAIELAKSGENVRVKARWEVDAKSGSNPQGASLVLILAADPASGAASRQTRITVRGIGGDGRRVFPPLAQTVFTKGDFVVTELPGGARYWVLNVPLAFSSCAR